MEAKEKKCDRCLFWIEDKYHGMISVDKEQITGECHRNPPATDGHLSFWPKTKCTSWCGEFKEGAK